GSVQVLNARYIPDERHGTGIEPAMNFRMAVGKGKSRGAIVIVSRPIHHGIGAAAEVGVHAQGEPSVVDAVFIFIQENEQLGWLRNVGEINKRSVKRIAR